MGEPRVWKIESKEHHQGVMYAFDGGNRERPWIIRGPSSPLVGPRLIRQFFDGETQVIPASSGLRVIRDLAVGPQHEIYVVESANFWGTTSRLLRFSLNATVPTEVLTAEKPITLRDRSADVRIRPLDVITNRCGEVLVAGLELPRLTPTIWRLEQHNEEWVVERVAGGGSRDAKAGAIATDISIGVYDKHLTSLKLFKTTEGFGFEIPGPNRPWRRGVNPEQFALFQRGSAGRYVVERVIRPRVEEAVSIEQLVQTAGGKFVALVVKRATAPTTDQYWLGEVDPETGEIKFLTVPSSYGDFEESRTVAALRESHLIAPDKMLALPNGGLILQGSKSMQLHYVGTGSASEELLNEILECAMERKTDPVYLAELDRRLDPFFAARPAPNTQPLFDEVVRERAAGTGPSKLLYLHQLPNELLLELKEFWGTNALEAQLTMMQAKSVKGVITKLRGL